ncbi:MAG: hypothetical protein DRO92_00265 [Candidatus Altiarchaeales archaeon]|nr:MAG: hypothetical protein DRO92_00265 [Candidatus Altiarchaeales archaeon]
MEFLRRLEIKPPRRRALDQYLILLEILNREIGKMESLLRKRARISREIEWLMSIPGIGFQNALLFQSEMGI